MTTPVVSPRVLEWARRTVAETPNPQLPLDCALRALAMHLSVGRRPEIEEVLRETITLYAKGAIIPEQNYQLLHAIMTNAVAGALQSLLDQLKAQPSQEWMIP